MKNIYLSLYLGFLQVFSWGALAYEADRKHHVVLTDIAVDMVNKCVEIDPSLGYSNIEDWRKILKDANLGEDISRLGHRMVNWHFYNPKVQKYRWVQNIVGSVDRSLFRIYRYAEVGSSIMGEMGRTNDRGKIIRLTGRALHYIEDMTVPAHIVPVYHLKGIKDQIDHYPVNDKKLRDEIKRLSVDKCGIMASPYEYSAEENYEPVDETKIADMWYILVDTSEHTRTQLDQSICGGEGKWKDYWRAPPAANNDSAARSKYFGQYGGGKYSITEPTRWGHRKDLFGRAGVSVKCENGELNLVTKDMYLDFVYELHLAAIHADMKMLFWAARKINDHSKNQARAEKK